MKLPIAILIATVLLTGATIFTNKNTSEPVISETSPNIVETANNVTIENGKQIIEIRAKGGYSPRTTKATAGIPTAIRFVTTNTFDCSIAVRIPSLSINEYLPPLATTTVDIGTPQVGTMRGVCGMGMYSFLIAFEK